MTRSEAHSLLASEAPYESGSLYGYHSCSTVWHTRPNAIWRIGIEAEKEDYDAQGIAVRYQGDRQEFLPYKWRAERDGSLGSGGFELISPVYNLQSPDLIQHIYDPVLGYLLNANTSIRCGGHITISKRDTTGAEVFAMLEPFVPLLYALYPKRAKTRGYASFVDKDMSKENKYCAFHIKSECVEIRLFSGIKNTVQLAWRIELLNIIVRMMPLDYTASNVYSNLLNSSSVLHRHLAKVYPKKMGEKIMLTHAYTKAYVKEGAMTFAEYAKIKSKVPGNVLTSRIPVLPAPNNNKPSHQLTLNVCDYLEENASEA